MPEVESRLMARREVIERQNVWVEVRRAPARARLQCGAAGGRREPDLSWEACDVRTDRRL